MDEVTLDGLVGYLLAQNLIEREREEDTALDTVLLEEILEQYGPILFTRLVNCLLRAGVLMTNGSVLQFYTKELKKMKRFSLNPTIKGVGIKSFLGLEEYLFEIGKITEKQYENMIKIRGQQRATREATRNCV
ncbi:hypothetical protein GF354_03360 [Candidatus Peregrinibacteria bacterium]|nr:hypothetical protein [Candidatus Peregrinibacteria bacterium]